MLAREVILERCRAVNLLQALQQNRQVSARHCQSDFAISMQLAFGHLYCRHRAFTSITADAFTDGKQNADLQAFANLPMTYQLGRS